MRTPPTALLQDEWSNAQASVGITIRLAGPLRRVFDLVTTPHFWPQWHPATLNVYGVTERPVTLGDVIYESVQIDTRIYHVTWTVVELIPYSRVVLRSASGRTRITYDFSERDLTTEFQRTLVYHPDTFLSPESSFASVHMLMEQQSTQALRQLQQLVAQLLECDVRSVMANLELSPATIRLKTTNT